VVVVKEPLVAVTVTE
jgi:hypothetical protein